jgi:glycosyltransferase involved in cell wall biosynthesis
MTALRLLTFNSHESYVSSLSRIGYTWDVIDNLPGRYTKSWDSRIRPLPSNMRLIPLSEWNPEPASYHCIIAHSIDDLLLARKINAPKIIVLHISLDGYIAQEGNKTDSDKARKALSTYLKLIKGLAISISVMKQSSWGVSGPVIPMGIDTDYFQGYHGRIAAGLRVANQLLQKDRMLDTGTHIRIIDGFPWKLAGHNPDIPGVTAAANSEELRQLYCSYRFYLHTAREGFEDGYNAASLEAMACGMPVVCNHSSSSPVINGVNGFMSDSIPELRKAVRLLLDDQSLAVRMGMEARRTVQENFSLSQFIRNWRNAIALAVELYSGGVSTIQSI